LPFSAWHSILLARRLVQILPMQFLGLLSSVFNFAVVGRLGRGITFFVHLEACPNIANAVSRHSCVFDVAVVGLPMHVVELSCLCAALRDLWLILSCLDSSLFG